MKLQQDQKAWLLHGKKAGRWSLKAIFSESRFEFFEMIAYFCQPYALFLKMNLKLRIEKRAPVSHLDFSSVGSKIVIIWNHQKPVPILRARVLSWMDASSTFFSSEMTWHTSLAILAPNFSFHPSSSGNSGTFSRSFKKERVTSYHGCRGRYKFVKCLDSQEK